MAREALLHRASIVLTRWSVRNLSRVTACQQMKAAATALFAQTRIASTLGLINKSISRRLDLWVGQQEVAVIGGVGGQVHFAQRGNASFAPTVNASTTFRYSSHSSGPISSHPPRFAWTPGDFNSRKLPWPPRGVRLNVSFAPPADCPNQALTAHVIYELYDAIPVFSKWVGPLP